MRAFVVLAETLSVIAGDHDQRRWLGATCRDRGRDPANLRIGILEAENRELRPAAEDFLEARTLWRELAEPLREAATSNELGLAYSYMGELAAAREALESALALWRDLGERFNEGLTRSNFCFLEQRSGALPAHERPMSRCGRAGGRA